jgi:hypothetical protein
MSQAEAAALLGVAVPTVKLRWMKARLQVQQALGRSPFDDTGSPGCHPSTRRCWPTGRRRP